MEGWRDGGMDGWIDTPVPWVGEWVGVCFLSFFLSVGR